MDQPALFHESLYDALKDCVRAIGKPADVGKAMRPEKSGEEARMWLSNCLNPERPEKLDPEQVMWILREARKVNCHAAFAYLARECGYADPQPIEPEDEKAALQREFIKQSRVMQQLFAHMERAGIRSVA